MTKCSGHCPSASEAMLPAAQALPASPHPSLEDALREVSLRPRRADAHVRLGQAHLAAGDLDASERSYRRAVQLQPDLEEAVAGVLRQLAVASARQRCRLVLPACAAGDALALTAVSPTALCLGAMHAQVVATASEAGGLKLWCLCTGVLLQAIDPEPQQHPAAAAWSPDGAQLAVLSACGRVGLWAPTGRGRPPLQRAGSSPELARPSGKTTHLAWSPGSEAVAWAGGGAIRVWAAGAAGLRAELSSQCSAVGSLFFSDTGALLVVAGAHLCEVWDWAAGTLLASVCWDSDITAAAFLPAQGSGGGSLLATAHVTDRQEGRILLWDVCGRKSGWVDGCLAAPALTLDGFAGPVVSLDACLASDGAALLAGACGDGSVRVFDVTAAAALPLFEASLASGGGGLGGQPAWRSDMLRQAANAGNLARFSAGGRLLALSGGGRHTVEVLDASDGSRVYSLEGHASTVVSLVFLGAQELLSASSDGCIRVWKLAK